MQLNDSAPVTAALHSAISASRTTARTPLSRPHPLHGAQACFVTPTPTEGRVAALCFRPEGGVRIEACDGPEMADRATATGQTQTAGFTHEEHSGWGRPPTRRLPLPVEGGREIEDIA